MTRMVMMKKIDGMVKLTSVIMMMLKSVISKVMNRMRTHAEVLLHMGQAPLSGVSNQGYPSCCHQPLPNHYRQLF